METIDCAPPDRHRGLILEEAQAGDLSTVAALMNRAYRGTGSVQGWSTEAAYITGDRATHEQLAADLHDQPEAHLLIHRPGDLILASVWLEPLGKGVWYLGALTVEPNRQDAGLGRRVLEDAEIWARRRGARQIRMTVVNVRETLIGWYIRRGYSLNGSTEPWPYGDNRFGTPLRPDLFFVVLEKTIRECSTELENGQSDEF